LFVSRTGGLSSLGGAVLCPGPSTQAKKGKRSLGESDIEQPPGDEDFQTGVMVSNYDVNLHVAIASLRRIDATAPPTTTGTKPLDFFAGPGNKRCS